MTFQDRVAEFHRACDFHIGQFGEVPPLEVRRSRAALIMEEARELVMELLADDPKWLYGQFQLVDPSTGLGIDARPVDLVKVAHETADLHYVTSGVSVNTGTDEARVFEAVHGANMLKAYLRDREAGDENGKARKPPGWEPVDVSDVLRPFEVDTSNAEAAARWLAEQSRHPLYQGERWRMLMNDESKVDHASRQAVHEMLPGGSTDDVINAVAVLRSYLHGRQRQ